MNTDNIKQEPADTWRSSIIEEAKEEPFEEPHSQVDITANIKHEPPVEFTCILPDTTEADRKTLKIASTTSLLCDVCRNEFETPDEAKAHQKKCRGKTKCEICLKFYVNIKSHVELKHVERKQQPYPYSCKVCFARFKQEISLSNHLSLYHREPFKCDLCKSVQFQTKQRMVEHMMTVHLNSSEYKTAKLTCQVCQKTTRTEKAMSMHKRTHLGKIECPICHKFFGRNMINIHIRLHEAKKEDPKFQCRVCKRLFFAAKNLDRHVLTHSKPIKCEFCSYRCSRKSLLTNHMNSTIHALDLKRKKVDPASEIYDTANIYKCVLCTRKNIFKTQSNAEKHIMLKHKSSIGDDIQKLYHKVLDVEKFQYCCDLCPKVCTNKPAVLMHLKISHFTKGRNFPCDGCNYKARTRANLRCHVRGQHGGKTTI